MLHFMACKDDPAGDVETDAGIHLWAQSAYVTRVTVLDAGGTPFDCRMLILGMKLSWV